MHKSFYASGFLFNPQTQQILLHQSFTSDNLSLFTGEGARDETATQTFQRIILEQLNIKISTNRIFEIYSYSHPESKKLYHVFYAETSVKADDAKSENMTNASWHSFKKLYKAKLDKGLLQDLVVGQRVINAALRVNL